MKDFQVVSSLVQLKALVAGLYGRIDAPVPTPTVDFAVDMFDREDQDTLGPYWSNTGYSIRSGLVISSAGFTPGLGYTGYLSDDVTRYRFLTYNIGTPVVASAVVYAADMSSPDFTCVVRSVVPGYANQAPPLYDGPVYYSHYAETAADRVASTQVAAGAGVCVANSQNSVYGVATQSALAPAQTMSDAQAVTKTASTPETMVSTITRGSTAPVVAIAVDPQINSGSGGTQATVVSASHNVMHVGTNIITARCAGDTVSMSANGVSLFFGVPATVSRKSRSRAGIMTGPFNSAAAYAAAPNAALGGISSFKVWRNDIPEPPNETGHGTYTKGRWQYTDKYHTPVTDKNGTVIRNEDGTVASYTYNPEA